MDLTANVKKTDQESNNVEERMPIQVDGEDIEVVNTSLAPLLLLLEEDQRK